MTLRETISSLLANPGEGSDPAAALAEAGFGDVAPEAFGTAVVHFSDTSSLPEADALAPIATRMSAVPFDDADLPPMDAEPSDDAFALFQAVDPDPGAFLAVEDADLPADFDSAADSPESVQAIADLTDPADLAGQDVPDLDAGFGVGDDLDEVVEAAVPEVTNIDDTVLEQSGLAPADAIDDEPFDDGFDAAFGENALTDAAADAGDLFSVDFSDGDDAETDPLDLDFG